MKRSVLVFAIALMVLLTTGLWYFQPNIRLHSTDIWHFGIIIILVGFALYVGFRRLASERRGEPVEDELSKKILQKAASWSYYFSLYMWVAMIYIKDRVKMDTEEILGTGILVMALAFGVFWTIFYLTGIKNE
jgi:peptidoglycan/LPS O-acetylase OafA/YrhL